MTARWLSIAKERFLSGGVGALIRLDGQKVVNLRNDQYAAIRVSPGNHQMGIEGLHVEKHLVAVALTENQELYFAVDPNPARWGTAFVALLDMETEIFLLKSGSADDFNAAASKLREKTVKYSDAWAS